MRLEDLTKPVSPEAPCGDDLLAADDPDFLDYYFNVEDRLPTAYFNIARGTLFDPRTVDHKAETAQIDPLLRRSRDLRLLVLEAKFQILAGRFKGFCEAVGAMAALMEAFPDDVHPQAGSDSTERRNALEELNALHTVVNPLDYATLLNDRRLGDVIYRAYGTGSGKIPPREGEEPGDSGAVLAALGNSENAKAVDLLNAQLTGLSGALNRMVAVCKAGPKPFAPTLTRLTDKIADMTAMVHLGRADLGGAAPVVAEAPVPVAAGLPAAAPVAVAPLTGVASAQSAFRLLEAVERYFARQEPSSLALVLVTQSRLLIGRPLVEALDVLLEESSGRATIDFGSDTGFSIPMHRMRQLSEAAGIVAVEDWAVDPDEPEAAAVLSRDQAGAVLKAVEDFYRVQEPASPIPILLFKARNLLSKDFHALVRELLPQDPNR
jgi:type VI secretion system protein ImpA